MPQTEPDIQELEAVIHNYTVFFIVFDIVFVVMLFTCVLILISYLKSRKNEQASDEYIRYTIQGQEEERARIARELHDTVAQNLRYCMSLCEKSKKSEDVRKVSEILSKSLVEVRAMSYNLSPPDITKNEFLVCVQNLCQEFLETAEIDVRLSILEGTDASFLEKEEILNLYRIIQEALTNIVKHAQSQEAVILIRNQSGSEEEGLYIFVSDDGIGFNTETIDKRKHFGLDGMKKRSVLIGARLAVTSNTDEGTQISIFKSKKRGGVSGA